LLGAGAMRLTYLCISANSFYGHMFGVCGFSKQCLLKP
jgi:hypothetical protein